MKKWILILVLSLVGTFAQAQEKKNKSAKHEIEVNGNCGMCEKRIEKAALSVKGVKVAEWHQDHHHLYIVMDETKCTLEQVHQAIANAGHDTDKVKAKDEVYENLHHCCKYERKL